MPIENVAARTLGVTLAGLLLLAACGSGTEPVTSTATTGSTASKGSTPGGTSPAGPLGTTAPVARASAGASTNDAVDAIDGLAVALYKELARTPGNLAFSPYSIETALAMTKNGAKGTTRSQMDAVLGAGAADELDKALNALDLELATRPGPKGDKQRNGDVDLATANALWGQEDSRFEQTFLDLLGAYYGAGMNLVDYRYDFEGARKRINDWTSDRTHGKIVDLLPPGSLSDRTRLVLTNAVYFKAPWLKRFDTFPVMFTKGGGAATPVDGMMVAKVGTYGEGTGWKAAEMPYLGNDLSMVVVVPDDLAAFESSLDPTKLRELTSGLKEQLASLQMPKFTFRTQVPLKAHLSTLGMPLPFQDDADFSGITTEEDLKISDVFHQAFIAVDEEGTEAAAATAVVMELTSSGCCKSLVVDKPFLFVIRDVKTNAVLFLGRVTDPTAH